jgi:hypothetical protein
MNNDQNNKNRQTRRTFLRNAGLGAAALTLGASLMKATEGLASAFGGGLTSPDAFFAAAREISTNNNDLTAITSVLNQFNTLLDTNPELDKNANAIFDYFTLNSDFGSDEETMNMAAALYMGGVSKLRRTSVSQKAISEALSNPNNIYTAFNSDFVVSVSRLSNSAVATDPEYAAKVQTSLEQLSTLDSTFLKRISCSINGKPKPCWLVGLVVVLVIILVILLI